MFLQDGHLTQVEVDEMLGLVSHVAAKVPPNDAVPGWIVFLVKLLEEKKKYTSVCQIVIYVFLNVVLLQSLRGTLNGVLLHVLRHVGIFDNSFAIQPPSSNVIWMTAT
uniref:Dynein light chain n=1 Tax=Gasterosteus aculeatus aculeatus TaxID=481459 RepID=A0AAQ4Q7R1_GASAC